MRGEHQFVDEPLHLNGEAAAAVQAERLHPQLTIRPWLDELVEAHGFGPRSNYVETCWLPVLGPTATWLYRRLGSWVEGYPEGLNVGLVDLSVGLGLGEGLGRHSKLTNAIGRLQRFDAARGHNDELLVRRALGPLPERYAERLSYSAYGFHEEAMQQLLRQAAS